MSNKLRGCPFCGKSVAYIADCHELQDCKNFEACEGEGYVSVVCNFNKGGCGASSGYFRTTEEAIFAWNRRADGWIPVSERMPEEYTMVLVWEGDYAFRAERAEGKWYEATNEPISEHINITHWMPLPPAPDCTESEAGA